MYVCVFKSKGPLPAQCGASEPSGEGGGQLLPAAVPRWGPHSERSAQHPALPADSGQLLPKLPEAKHLPRTCGGWRGGWWLSPKFHAFLLKASLWTVCHLHQLGSDCQAHGPNSRKQAHPITPENPGTLVCFSLLQTLIYTVLRYICEFVYKILLRWCGPKVCWFCKRFTEIFQTDCMI